MAHQYAIEDGAAFRRAEIDTANETIIDRLFGGQTYALPLRPEQRGITKYDPRDTGYQDTVIPDLATLDLAQTVLAQLLESVRLFAEQNATEDSAALPRAHRRYRRC